MQLAQSRADALAARESLKESEASLRAAKELAQQERAQSWESLEALRTQLVRPRLFLFSSSFFLRSIVFLFRFNPAPASSLSPFPRRLLFPPSTEQAGLRLRGFLSGRARSARSEPARSRGCHGGSQARAGFLARGCEGGGGPGKSQGPGRHRRPAKPAGALGCLSGLSDLHWAADPFVGLSSMSFLVSEHCSSSLPVFLSLIRRFGLHFRRSPPWTPRPRQRLSRSSSLRAGPMPSPPGRP